MATDQAAQASLKALSSSAIKADPKLKDKFDKGSTQRHTNSTFEIGVITRVDYEKFTAALRTSAADYQHIAIPLTFAAAGKRHFMGSLPEIGDTCIVGWGAQQSGVSRQPIIVGWVLSGVMAGHDWWPMQDHAPEEWGYTPKEQAQWEGIADRVRHKLRHMLPGNIVASSSQGADLVLNEGVMLANRRGNEIQLRDQDQAFVVRSLQQFHAGSGFRTYAGMVQRDALLLPTSMFSDGTDYNAAQQVDAEGFPLGLSALAKSRVPAGTLTPNPVFTAGLSMGSEIDPRLFLQNALMVDSAGQLTGSRVTTSDASYGGKSTYRVSTGGTNSAIDTEAKALTEYRIELSHTSDGTLPVTEQTDGFDADRLPGTSPLNDTPLNGTGPFIESVLGSVVGNDPFTRAGKLLYGVPLRPTVFSGSVRAPALVAGGQDLSGHAATLFRLTPPLNASADPTWWSVTKDGRVHASVASASGYSGEFAFGSGVRLGAGKTKEGESFRFEGDGKITLRSVRGDTATNRGVDISAEQGAVRIFGGQAETVGGIATRSGTPVGGGQTSLPAVTLESGGNMLVKSTGTLLLSAPEVHVRNAATMTVTTSGAVQVAAGDNLSLSGKSLDITSMGKATLTYGGPKDGDPSGGALRETQIVGNPATGFAGGVADKYSLLYGDREEELIAGNLTTTMLVGDVTYALVAGTWAVVAGTNSAVVAPDGIQVTASAGSMSFNAVAGGVSINSGVAISLSTSGPVTVRGGSVGLVAPFGGFGGIVSGSDIDPVSGLPLSLLGMGSAGHYLAIG